MSVDENEIDRTGQRHFSNCAENENSIKSEVANLPKILNGPKGKVASKTVASIEVLNGVTKRETPESLGIISM